MTPFPAPPRPRSRSPLPLLVAGAAFALTAWLAWERFRPAPLFTEADSRPVAARGELADFETTTIRIFERNAPSVVHIRSPEVLVPINRIQAQRVPEGTGTGFVWDPRGYIVTNHHVVQGRQNVKVRLAGRTEYDAVVVGTEPSQDIAVLKITVVPENLRPIPLGTSKDLLVGQMVLAIGNPFGLDKSLSTGVVSALDRVIFSGQQTPIEGVIQCDAAINPGNSGGPLLDSAGRLIGMNTAIYSRSGESAGIGFAIPADTINRVVPRLIRGDRGQRPVLGIQATPAQLTNGASHPIILSVEAGSGAAQAGLRAGNRDGDIILEIDGVAVTRVEDIRAILENREVGDKVKLRVLRATEEGDQPIEVEVPLLMAAPR